MKPIRITLYKRTDIHTWSPYRMLTAGTWGQAKRKAKKALGPLVTTDAMWHQDYARAPFARLERRPGRLSQFVSPEVIEVPSVGELGYW